MGSIRTLRQDGDTRTVDQLGRMAHQLVDELLHEIKWKKDYAYGAVKQDSAGPVSGGGHSDPTLAEAVAKAAHRRKVGRAVGDLKFLVDRKLPEMLGRLSVDDDMQLVSDEEKNAYVDGGLSAYRKGSKAPAGRPDLQEALDAQQRRLDRGEAYGAG